MKITHLLLFVLTYSISYSQTLKTNIYTEEGLQIFDCNLFINKTKISPAIENNFYYIKVKEGDLFTIKHSNFEIENYSIPSIQKNDTITHQFILHEKAKLLEEVVVVGKRNVQFAGEFNENILDYLIEPTKKCMLLIKSIKNDYYLEFKNDTISRNYLLNIYPESLQLDFMGNIQLLSKDSAYQIWISKSQEIEFIDIISLKQYNKKIKPCIAKRNTNLFKEKILSQNQEYEVTFSNNLVTDSIIHHVCDTISATVAQEGYNEIIQLYNNTVPPETNLISLGIWDGNLSQLGETNVIVAKISWQKVRSKPISCNAFGMLDYICVVNIYDSVLSKINYDGNLINIVSFDTKELKNIKIIYDYFYDKIYLTAICNKERLVYSVDEKTGNKKKVGNLNGHIIPSNIKIIGDYIYFIRRNEAGYNKLYRKNLRE